MILKDNQKFANEFLESYLHNGLGSLSKKYTELLVLNLLLEDGVIENRYDYFMLSRLLKITPTKAKNLIYELELRYSENIIFEAVFAQVLSQYEVVLDESTTKPSIKLYVTNPMYRDVIEQKLQEFRFFNDTSHNKNIMTVSLVAFKKLLDITLQDTKVTIDGKSFEVPKGSSFGTELFKIFAKSIAEESGKNLVNIAVSSLQNGGSGYVFGLIKQIKEKII